MHRFFSPFQQTSNDKITISDKATLHHIQKALRIKEGEEIVVCDPCAGEYTVVIEKLLPKSIIARIKEKRSPKLSQKKINLTIACAIPKKSRMGDIIDKLTQLGVDRIIPLETERVIIKLDQYKKALRHKRWEKIAQGAAQQSQRSGIPVIEPIKDIKEVVYHSGASDLKLIPTLTGERKSLKEVFAQTRPRDVLVLIGPEGDFTDGEVLLAKNAGFIPLSLGDLVLRVDTAAVAVASFIRLYNENH